MSRIFNTIKSWIDFRFLAHRRFKKRLLEILEEDLASDDPQALATVHNGKTIKLWCGNGCIYLNDYWIHFADKSGVAIFSGRLRFNPFNRLWNKIPVIKEEAERKKRVAENERKQMESWRSIEL